MLNLFLSEILRYFIEIAQGQQEAVGLHSVLAKRPQVLLHSRHPALQPAGAGTTQTHGHHVYGQVLDADVMHIDEAQQQVEVCRYLVVCLVSAVLLETLPAAIERRMGWYEAQPHQAAPEYLGGVIAHATVQVIGMHEVNVAIHGIHLVVCKTIRNLLQYIIAGEEVVGVQDTDYIARCHTDAFVHSIVQAAVGFANPTHTAVEFRFVSTDDVQGIVLGGTVY